MTALAGDDRDNKHQIEIVEDTGVTQLEVRCSCGFTQAANCPRHARAVADSHIAKYLREKNPVIVDRATGEQPYSCVECGELRTKAEGGTVFTVCDNCWDKHHPPRGSAPPKGGHAVSEYTNKLLVASRELLIEEILRLRGDVAHAERERDEARTICEATELVLASRERTISTLRALLAEVCGIASRGCKAMSWSTDNQRIDEIAKEGGAGDV